MKPLIQLGQITIRFLLESADTNGVMAMFEFAVPAGAKVPVPHYHKAYDETVYGLEGTLRFVVEGKAIDIAPGDSYFIPRGAVHGFDNPGTQNARALAIITPALLGPSFFQEMAAEVQRATPPNMEALTAIMLKHGLVPAPPRPGV